MNTTFLTWTEPDAPAKAESLSILQYRALMTEWAPKGAVK